MNQQKNTPRLLMALVLTSLSILTGLASAQGYPNHTVRMIVPLTTGSGADIAGRVLAKSLTESWKQPVIIENRPGAGGLIGTGVVVNSDPDGYTLLVQSASYAANPAIYKKLPYDPLKSLIDVAILGQTPYVLLMVLINLFATSSLPPNPNQVKSPLLLPVLVVQLTWQQSTSIK